MVSDDAKRDGRAAPKRSRRFYYVRVGLLLFVLFVVVLYAIRDLRSRGARRDWDRTLDVAIVLVHVAGTDPPPEAALDALRDRKDALEARLAAELARHRGSTVVSPFRFRVFGLTEAATPPPALAGEGPADLARLAVDLARWVGAVDPAAGVVPDHYDTRIYVAVQKPRSAARTAVEGRSEQDGRIGLVEVELDASMVDLTLFVVTHELLHTLGASDKYDAQGRARVPEGLAEPGRSPLYPQRYAEVMARNRPLAPDREVVPESLDELAVGDLTAKEIGWTKP